MHLLRTATAATWILLFSASYGVASDWPQFLGSTRTGVSAETGLIVPGTNGPNVVWKETIGTGMSNVAIRGDRLFTMAQDETDQWALCLDALTGKPVWKTRVDAAYENAMGNGPRATPTLSGDTVCVFTGAGQLSALDSANGRIRWQADLPALTSGKSAEYGNASSPLIAGSLVIVQFDAAEAAVVACDLKTGAIRWQAGHSTAGYSSPALMTLAGRQQIVASTGSAVIGVDPESGSVLWTFPWVTEYDCNTATPVLIDDSQVLISSGENHGSAILKVSESGSAMTAKPVWNSEGPDSVLRAEWQTPVLIDGHLYGLDNSGSAGPITNLVCVRLSDGQQLWNVRRFGKSNFTVADGRLWFSTMKGELVVGTATPDGFQELSRHTLCGTTRQAPVIASGKLYLRDETQVVCMDIGAAN